MSPPYAMLLDMRKNVPIGTREAAEFIGVHRSVITRAVQSGELESTHRLPGYAGVLLFTRSELTRYKNERLRHPKRPGRKTAMSA